MSSPRGRGRAVRVLRADRGAREHYRLQAHAGQGDVPAANRFLDAAEIRGLSPRTVRAYAFDLVDLFRWLRRRHKRVVALRESDLLDWVSHQHGRGAKPRSVNRRLTVCRLFYRFVVGHEIPRGRFAATTAAHHGGVGRDRVLGLHTRRRPGRLHHRVKVPRTLVEPLVPEQVRAFLRQLRR
jgi:hypothetical protein